jgi:hypothetical protein
MASQTPPKLPTQRQMLRREDALVFRVRIGVTGHRTLADEDYVARGGVQRFEQVRNMFPPTDVTPVVFTVLTALAEGADLVVTRAALGALADPGVELEAVLPLTQAVYLDDFATSESREEFETLLSDSAARIELDDAAEPHDRERAAAYDRAGRYIVDRSDIVIAVWDGAEPRGQGGTAEIVAYAHRRGVPVLVVPIPGTPDTDAGFVDGPARHQGAPRFLASMESFRMIDECNRVSIRDGSGHTQLESAHARLGEPLEDSPMHWQFVLVADWALPHFVRSDKLARHYQSLHRALGWSIRLLAACAVAAVAAQAAFAPDEPGWLGVEIGIVVALIGLVWLARRNRPHERWIAYRSLAEAFRSAVFIALSGVHDSRKPESLAHIYELDESWFQRAFSETWRRRPVITLDPANAPDLRRLLVESWIGDQIKYHEEAAQRCRRHGNLQTLAISLIAVATIIVAALHIGEVGHKQFGGELFVFLAITLPAVGAALTGLREHGHHRLHEERSNRTVDRLKRLKHQHELPGDRDHPRADQDEPSALSLVGRLAVETQRVILEENLDWFGVIEFQDLEMVI